MAQRPRTTLYPEFDDGERPSGADFKDLIDSFLNIADDPISIDSNNNLIFNNAIRIGNTTDETLGNIRFDGTKFQFREATGWVDIGSGGAFEEIDGGPHVAYNTGNVGINTGDTPAIYKLEVNIGSNNGEGNRVRFGSTAIHDSQTTAKRAYFSHVNHANNTDYALTQHNNGRVHLNAPSDQPIRFSLGGSNVHMSVIPTGTGSGITVVGAASPSVSPGDFPDVTLFVEGDAFKSKGVNTWVTCDNRLKKEIRSFDDGLEIIKKINPIRFQFNGKAWTKEGAHAIGVSGQEIEKIAPYMIRKAKVNKEVDAKDTNEYLLFNSQPLIFLAINAVKELTKKIEDLEKQIIK